MTNFFESKGKLRYSFQGDFKLILDVDQQLSDYYRSLIPKWKNIIRPGRMAHITLSRANQDRPKNMKAWGKYKFHTIPFLYDPHVYNNSLFYWLDVHSNELEGIKRELGLPIVPAKNPPRYDLGYQEVFHITIGTKKDRF